MSKDLEFTVANSHDTSMTIPGVSVSVLMRSGEEVLVGETTGFGAIRVPKSLLAPEQARVVLFCQPIFFCAAVRADDPKNDLRRWDEYFVTIAPIVVH